MTPIPQHLTDERDALIEKLAEALEYAVSKYGKEGGPWNVPSDAGGWISTSREALEAYAKYKESNHD